MLKTTNNGSLLNYEEALDWLYSHLDVDGLYFEHLASTKFIGLKLQALSELAGYEKVEDSHFSLNQIMYLYRNIRDDLELFEKFS